MKKYTLHPSIIKNIDTLKSEILKNAVKEFINFTPIDFVVLDTGAFRTPELQNAIFKKVPKVTNCDGYKFKSEHQSGLAVDLVPWINGKPSWDQKHCDVLAGGFATFLNIKEIYFIGGYDWNKDGVLDESFYDPCHFEVTE